MYKFILCVLPVAEYFARLCTNRRQRTSLSIVFVYLIVGENAARSDRVIEKLPSFFIFIVNFCICCAEMTLMIVAIVAVVGLVFIAIIVCVIVIFVVRLCPYCSLTDD